jgi:uncharacterized protein
MLVGHAPPNRRGSSRCPSGGGFHNLCKAGLNAPPPASPLALLRNQLRSLLRTMPQVRLALLFGSQARGTARADSDVDVAYLLALGSALSQAVGKTVDIVSLEDPGFALREELVRDGVSVYEAAPGVAALWRSHALSKFDLDRVGRAHARRLAHSRRERRALMVNRTLAVDQAGRACRSRRPSAPASQAELGRAQAGSRCGGARSVQLIARRAGMCGHREPLHCR